MTGSRDRVIFVYSRWKKGCDSTRAACCDRDKLKLNDSLWLTTDKDTFYGQK